MSDMIERLMGQLGKAAAEIASLRSQLEELSEKLMLHQSDAKMAWGQCHGLRMELAEARSQLEEARRANEWQPIETAPKKTRVILARWSDGMVFEGYWGTAGYNRSKRDYEFAWVSSPNSGDMKPTNWRPLPTPPAAIRSLSQERTDVHNL